MLIAFRDYVAGGTISDLSPSPGHFIATMPKTNAQDRRLAVKAGYITSMSGQMHLKIDLGAGYDVGMFAILAHTFEGIADVDIAFQTTGGTVYSASFTPWVPPTDSQFPRHLLHVADQNYSNVRYVDIIVETSGGSQQYEFGRIWAGPFWSPTRKTARRNFRIQTRDDSIINKSSGQQAYADYRPRFRQLTCTLPYLTEAEAIGEEDGQTHNLQDIGFEVGRAGEVIVIPSQSSNQVIHKFGVYGHFEEAPPVDLIEGSRGRKYESTFDVIEDL